MTQEQKGRQGNTKIWRKGERKAMDTKRLCAHALKIEDNNNEDIIMNNLVSSAGDNF